MCYTFVPGKTGCLAVRDVPAPIVAPTKKKEKVTKTPTIVVEPHFSGVEIIKTFLTWEQDNAKYHRMMRNERARNAKRHKTGSRRKTIRQFARI